MNVLRPYDSAILKTYSDARNVLTGVIDSPDTLQAVASGFVKTLTWVILKHCAKRNGNTHRTSNGVHVSTEVKAHGVTQNGTSELLFKNATRPKSAESKVRSRKNSRKSSVVSLADSIWSDDNESLILEPINNRNKVSLNVHKQKSDISSVLDLENTLNSTVGSKKTEISYLKEGVGNSSHKQFANDDPFGDLDFGLPALDIGQTHSQLPANPFVSNSKSYDQKGSINLASEKFQSPYSCALSLPLAWQVIPLQHSQLHAVNRLFSDDWFKHVVMLLDLATSSRDETSEDIKTSIMKDETLLRAYSQLIMACYSIVNVMGKCVHMVIGHASLVFMIRDVTRFTPLLARLVQ